MPELDPWAIVGWAFIFLLATWAILSGISLVV